MVKETLNVEGMSCGHCENAVKTAVSAVGGVKKVKVSLKKKTAAVVYDETKTSRAAIAAVIVDAGYKVQ